MVDVTDETWPRISVVMPVRNESSFIRETIEHLQKQDYPRDKLEIIVVDGRSRDDTRKIVSAIADEDSRVKLLDNPRQLSSAARNVGVKSASGDVVVFVDGHVYIDNHQLLKNTVKLMNAREVSVLSRPQLLDTPANTLFQRAVSFARKSVIGHGLDSTIYTLEERYVNPASSGASYRREVFDRVGLFDETFDAAEDVDFNFRVHLAGYRSYTSPALTVYYYPRTNFSGLFRQMVRYGTGRFRILRKHGVSGSIAGLTPAMLIAGLSLFLVLAPVITFYPLLVCGGIYLASIMLVSFAVSLRRGIKFLPVLPPVFATIHFGLGWGLIREMLISAGKKFRLPRASS